MNIHPLRTRVLMQAKARIKDAFQEPPKRGVLFEPWRLVLIAVFFLSLGVLLGWFIHGFYASSAAGPMGIPPGEIAVPHPGGEGIQAILDHILQAEAQMRARPDDLAQRVHLGNLYFDLGDAREASGDPRQGREAFLKAIAHYEAAKDAGDASPDLLTDLGTMYYRTGQPERAVRAYEQAIAANPNHRNAWMNLGIVKREALKDIPGAIEAWQQCLKLSPTGPDADRIRAWLSQVGVAVVPGG